MSTKIYTAYRLPHNSKTWDTLVDAQRKATANVTEALKKYYLETLERLRQHPPGTEEGDAIRERFEIKGDRAYDCSVYDLGMGMYKLYREAHASPYRGLYDLDVSLVARKSGRWVYVIPHADGFLMGKVWNFLKTDERFQEYGYWNNTDMPEGMTKREWSARRRAWEPLLNYPEWCQYLVLEVMHPSRFFYVDPSWSMADSDRERKVKLYVAEHPKP